MRVAGGLGGRDEAGRGGHRLVSRSSGRQGEYEACPGEGTADVVLAILCSNVTRNPQARDCCSVPATPNSAKANPVTATAARDSP
jgi:hypothetical protein